jgi:AcrR family transcriptional regulator
MNRTEPGAARRPPPSPADLIPSQRERRTRIVRAALRLLESGEYDDVQMKDVAEHAGVALGTVYRYFGSKEHLFAAVLVEWGASLQHRVQLRPLSGDVAQRLTDLFDRIVGAFARLPQFYRLMAVVETTADPRAAELFDEFNGRTRSTFDEAVATLELDDGAAIVEMLLAVLGTVMRAWSLGRITTDEAQRRLHAAVRLVFSPPPEVRVRG